jgi:phospholipid N-methyltransferase
MSDALHFLRAWLTDPGGVAAVAPSSPAVAELITSEITPRSAPVIELGPGTGVFTRALLERGVPQERLALVDSSEEFARLLERRFPAAHILRMDAAKLGAAAPFDGERAGAVVSGLPLLSMPRKKAMAILKSAFEHLRPDGAFYQFTYGVRSPVPRAMLERLGLEATRIGWTIANVPPAAVYRFRRRQR